MKNYRWGGPGVELHHGEGFKVYQLGDIVPLTDIQVEWYRDSGQIFTEVTGDTYLDGTHSKRTDEHMADQRVTANTSQQTKEVPTPQHPVTTAAPMTADGIKTTAPLSKADLDAAAERIADANEARGDTIVQTPSSEDMKPVEPSPFGTPTLDPLPSPSLGDDLIVGERDKADKKAYPEPKTVAKDAPKPPSSSSGYKYNPAADKHK